MTADLTHAPAITTAFAARTVGMLPQWAAFTTVDGCEAVVLDTAAEFSTEVFELGAEEIIRYTVERPVTEVTDPTEKLRIVAHVLAAIDARRRSALELPIQLRHEHSTELETIRTYAVERHQAGDICRDGLNAFLRRFGMGEYKPRVRVTFTVTGSYEISLSDPSAARIDARGYLRPDVDDLDGVVEDSLSYEVDASAEELDSEG